MKALFLYVSTNMCRDGDLWYYDEGVASSVSCLRERGHEFAFRLVAPGEGLEQVVPWVERERGERTLIVFLTSVLFSAYAHDIPDTFDGVRDLKRATGLPTAFVGMWATANAEALIEHPGIDFVGRGEIDHALVDLCDALDRDAPTNAIPSIWSKSDGQIHRPPLRPLIAELGSLPLPARDVLPLEEHANERDGILTIVAARGCPMDCAFCTHHVMRRLYDVSPGRYVRVKPVSFVLDEIRAARATNPRLWGIFFHDDIFVASAAWRREFFRRYPREVGLPFGCNLIIEQVQSSFVHDLRTAGCCHVQIGVESGSPFLRNEVAGKDIGEPRIHAALHLLQSAGIMVKFFALIGIPNETPARFVESFKGFARFCPDMVQVQVWMAHEGSELLATDREAGRVARRQYDPRGDRRAWRLKFYFRFFHRYVALYHLLAREERARWRAGLVRALVTASVRMPWAPALLLTQDWSGARRWPSRFRFVARAALWCLGAFGRRLRGDVERLEQRLSADYLMPAGIARPVEDGWRVDARIDRRLDAARVQQAPVGAGS